LPMADFLRLATGGVSAARLLVSRRLRVRGDLRLAIRLARLFDIPGG
jgi:predicted lipid carrier protein YhbT